MEAIACGTPVITFNTGGSPECIDDTCGVVIEKNDFEALVHNIMKVYNNSSLHQESCLKRARTFDVKDKFEEYVKLYSTL